MTGLPIELPGVKALESAMTAPADLMGLATRQAVEAVDTLNTGVTRTLGALELPGLPPAAQMLPIGLGAPDVIAPAAKVSGGDPVRRSSISTSYGED